MQCRLFYCIMENEQRGMITFILAVCGNVDYVYSFPLSPPSRAAWIEIATDIGTNMTAHCRRLHGRRRLKFRYGNKAPCRIVSPPSRAAWIEIRRFRRPLWLRQSRRLHGRRGLKSPCRIKCSFRKPSPPSRAAWIEIRICGCAAVAVRSPPSRAAWIEI